MVKALSAVVILLLTTSLASAQAVNPARQYEQQRNSQSPADGVWYVYDRNGKLQKEEHYKAYRLDGDIKEFNESGGLKSITPYVDGSRHGWQKAYYPSGALQSESLYQNNNLNGQLKEYYETGELKRTAEYTNGQLDGLSKMYYQTGALKQQWNFKKGVVHGTVLNYGEDGHVTSEDIYQNGVLSAHKDYTKDIAAMTAGPKGTSTISNTPAAADLKPQPPADKAKPPASPYK